MIRAGVATGALALTDVTGGQAAKTTPVAVLSALPPNYAPPGIGGYAGDLVAGWLSTNSAWLNYESVAWENLPGKIAANIRSGAHVYDVIAMSGWVPRFSEALLPLEERIDRRLRIDLPASAYRAVSWEGQLYALPATLSLLTLFYNVEHLDAAGIDRPPETWDELKATAAALTREGRYGWRMNLANPVGIGGTASYWMTFLQQAGGTMYGDDGRPVFDDEPGVQALQLMIDLLPSTDPRSFTDTGIVDTTLGLRNGSCSMAMNWPFMWRTVQSDPTAASYGAFATAVLPAGPAGTASLDGSDGWSIRRNTPIPKLATSLIAFYLDKRVQKQMALTTDWLPARLSVLADNDVQAAAPHAATLLAQAKQPFANFVTPDYDAVTQAIGDEVVAALKGIKTAKQAVADAAAAVDAIVKNKRT